MDVVNTYIPRIGSLSGYWIPLICFFLIFAPLPLGLRTAGLSLAALSGIALACLSGLIATRKLKTIGWFALIVFLGTLLNVLRGEPFSFFQFVRGTTFCLVGLWLAVEKIDDRLFRAFDRMTPVLVIGAFLSAILYLGFGLEYYNSQLDIPFDLLENKRIYIYPSLFFLVLFIDAVLASRTTQIVYLALLIVTVSKTFFIVIALTYLLHIIANRSLKRTVFSLGMLVLAAGLAVVGQLQDRIGMFVEEGDPWRLLEPLAALERLADPVRFIFGNGAGIPYWGGRESVIDYDEVQRVVENSFFDVHNGFLTLFLRFGVIGALFYIYLFVRSIPRSNSLDVAVFSIAVLINVFVSHGPVQTVEVLGLVLGLRLVQYRRQVLGMSS